MFWSPTTILNWHLHSCVPFAAVLESSTAALVRARPRFWGGGNCPQLSLPTMIPTFFSQLSQLSLGLLYLWMPPFRVAHAALDHHSCSCSQTQTWSVSLALLLLLIPFQFIFHAKTFFTRLKINTHTHRPESAHAGFFLAVIPGRPDLVSMLTLGGSILSPGFPSLPLTVEISSSPHPP